jgi:UDP-2,3-diacylglucosamine pyrophosphatase LpxH
VLISDTHFGVGHAASGKWDNLEDARWAPEFTAFLKEIDKQGKGAADLVINGDAFELWQSLAMDCIYPDAAHQDRDLGCTEQDALRRVNRVLGQHSPELKALGDFASSGNNRLILVPGNHDAVPRSWKGSARRHCRDGE